MWIILAVAILAILLLSRTSFEIRDEIEINASADKVWATVIDFENYKNGNHHHLIHFCFISVPRI